MIKFILWLAFIFACFIGECNSKKLKILYVVSRFPTYESNMISPLEGLVSAGHDVTIYSRKLVGSKDQYREFLCKKNLEQCLEKTIVYDKSKSKLSEYDFLRLLNYDNFDLIFCTVGTHAYPFTKLKMKKILGKPIVVCYRGADLTRDFGKKRLKIKTSDQYVDLYVVVCNYFQKLLNNTGINKNKIKVVYSSIDMDMFPYKLYPHHNDDSDKTVLLTVARLIEKKGIEYAIKAVAQLIQEGHNIEYLIAGRGKIMTNLFNLIQSLDMGEHIKLLGRKSAPEILTLLHQADAFLHPSVMASDGNCEGIPRSIKEAMSSGLIPITTEHSGIPECVQDGVTGILVQERDIESTKKGIKTFLSLSLEEKNTMVLNGISILRLSHKKNIVNKRLNNFLCSI